MPTPPDDAEAAPRDIDALRRDPRRLAAARASGLLDTAPEACFDRLTRIAARMTSAPATFLSVVDASRDFYKSHHGFGEPLATTRELEGRTFCHLALQSPAPLVIDDVSSQAAYQSVPTVESLGVRAYLGVPLVLEDGQIIGSFCAIDFAPRHWSDDEIELMRELASAAIQEVRLRQALHDARQSAREREEILAVVAHDLRTPISIVNLAMHKLGKMAGEPGVEFSLRSAKAIESMTSMMDDLLETAKLTRSTIVLKRQSLSVADLLRDVVTMMGPVGERRGIVVSAQPVAPGMRVDGDYQRLLRIFSNLVGNAIKFSSEGHRVTIAARDEGERIVFDVADQGAGMRPEQLARVFDQFWQADSHDVRGAGLGLSIVRSLVVAHGGEIAAVSEPGRGSTFSFQIPRQ